MSDNKLTDETGRKSLDPKHAPVTIPAGSFDVDDLHKGLEKAVDVAPDKRQGKVDAALEKAASEDTNLDQSNPSHIPGYVHKVVEHPELGIKESIQVYDASGAEKIERARAAEQERIDAAQQSSVEAANTAAAEADAAAVPSTTKAVTTAKSE